MVCMSQVYETVEYAVYMHTNLLYNRHLDQVLLSALYGYCKVRNHRLIATTTLDNAALPPRSTKGAICTTQPTHAAGQRQR